MIVAMTTILTLLVLAAGLRGLVAYARHDRFAGPGNVAVSFDDLGPVTPHLVRF